MFLQRFQFIGGSLTILRLRNRVNCSINLIRVSHKSLETAVFRKFLSIKTAPLHLNSKGRKLCLKYSQLFFFTAAIFIGQQIVFSCNKYSNVAQAAPGDPNENWYLKKNGKLTIVRIIKGDISTDMANQYTADINVNIHSKEGSRPHTMIYITEHEQKEQFTGKGKYFSIYTGTFDGSRVKGTYYDNDGASGPFTLTLTK